MRKTLSLLLSSALTLTGLSGCLSDYTSRNSDHIPTLYTWTEVENNQQMIHLKTYGDLQTGIREAICNFYSNKEEKVKIDEKDLQKEVDSAFIYIVRRFGIVKSGEDLCFPASIIHGH